MSDVRTMLERGVGGATPPPDGFERMLRRRERRHRNQRIAAGVVGFAIFLAAIWIVATGGPFDRALTPAVPGQETGPTLPEGAAGIGLKGLALEGATPSTPETGELVLNILFGHVSGGDPGRFRVYLYADGRLIWERLADRTGGANPYATPYSTGLVEQRLTPEGVELLRSEVLSTGLFDHDLNLSSGEGLYFGRIEVRDGARFVRVTWGECCEPGNEDVPRTSPTPEQASALEQLDARFANPAAWLPASAWEAREIRAFVPSRYSLCLERLGDVALAQVLASLPHPAEDLLRAWNQTFDKSSYRAGLRTTAYVWCSATTTERARALAEVLRDAGIRDNGGDIFGLVFHAEQDGPDVSISFDALLPNQS